jgi:hypothetical protein
VRWCRFGGGGVTVARASPPSPAKHKDKAEIIARSCMLSGRAPSFQEHRFSLRETPPAGRKNQPTSHESNTNRKGAAPGVSLYGRLDHSHNRDFS